MLNTANFAVSSLAEPVLATATSFPILSDTGGRFPDPPFLLVVGEGEHIEIIKITSKIGDVLGCESLENRGQEGTPMLAHPAASKVRNAFTAGTVEKIFVAISEHEGSLVDGGAVHGLRVNDSGEESFLEFWNGEEWVEISSGDLQAHLDASIDEEAVHGLRVGTGGDLEYYDGEAWKEISVGGDPLIIGEGATAEEGIEGAVSIGSYASAAGDNGVTIGRSAGSDEDAIAIGSWADANQKGAIAIGKETWTKKEKAIAIGEKAVANEDSIVIGVDVEGGDGTVAIGHGMEVSTGINNVFVGYFLDAKTSDPEVPCERNVIVGAASKTNGSNNVVIGQVARSGDSESDKVNYAVCVGNNAQAEANYSIAVGNHTYANAEGSVALGAANQSSAVGSITIGRSAQAYQEDGIAIGRSAIVNDSGKTNGVVIGANKQCTGADSIAILANCYADRAIVIGAGAAGHSDSALAIGDGATGYGTGVAIGKEATAQPDNLAIGNGASADGQPNCIAIGKGANAMNNIQSIAIGEDVVVGGQCVAIGYKANTKGSSTGITLVGSEALVVTEAYDSMAIGNEAKIAGELSINSIALGGGATASGEGAVAIGVGVTADEDHTAVLGLPVDSEVLGPAEMGNGTWHWKVPGTFQVRDRHVTRKFSETVGDDNETEFDIEHELGTRDVVVSVRESGSPYGVKTEGIEVEVTDEDNIKITFSEAPDTDEFVVTIIG